MLAQYLSGVVPQYNYSYVYLKCCYFIPAKLSSDFHDLLTMTILILSFVERLSSFGDRRLILFQSVILKGGHSSGLDNDGLKHVFYLEVFHCTMFTSSVS